MTAQVRTYPKKPPRQLFLSDELSFGKWSGYTLAEVKKKDKGWFDWAIREKVIVIKGATRPKPICLPEDEGWDEIPLLDLLRWSSGVSMRLKPNLVSLIQRFEI